MAQNALTGPIPDLSPIKNLRNLLLYHNKFTGAIPTSLFSLLNLEILFLSSNQLTSSVPGEIANLKGQLRGLYLSDNQLDGEIPAALCELQQLGKQAPLDMFIVAVTFLISLISHRTLLLFSVFIEALLLDENGFQGTIPACFGELQQLRQLYVFKNQLSGDLPGELAELSWLTGLGLEDNNFEGDVPLEICSLKDNDNNFDLWADCGGDSAELLCPCCTVCCPGPECE